MIQVENLSYGFPDKELYHDISFRLEAGRHCALIGSNGSKTMMAVGVSKNAQARGLKAGALVKKIAAIAGGNGGGKPDFAMAGIRDTSKIDDALNAVPEIVKAEMQ